MELPKPKERVLPLGTQTQWGEVAAVGITGGERYYWLVDEHGDVSMMSADVVEPIEKE